MSLHSPSNHCEDNNLVNDALSDFSEAELVSLVDLYQYHQDMAKAESFHMFHRIKVFFEQLIVLLQEEFSSHEDIQDLPKNFDKRDEEAWLFIIQNMSTQNNPDGPQESDIPTFFTGFVNADHENWQRLTKKCERFYDANKNQLGFA